MDATDLFTGAPCGHPVDARSPVTRPDGTVLVVCHGCGLAVAGHDPALRTPRTAFQVNGRKA